MFAVGLAIRYFLTYQEDRIHDQVEKKPRIVVSDHKLSSTVDSVDQVDSSHQAYLSKNTHKLAQCASFQELKHSSEKSIASEKGVRTRIQTVSEASWKDSDSVDMRTEVLGRRRTVSEGHCYAECQSIDDTVYMPEIKTTVNSPPTTEHRSLEECKSILKQSVCEPLVLCL